MDDNAADDSLTRQMVGSWRMMSWICEILATGERFDGLGPNPKGYITYTPVES